MREQVNNRIDSKLEQMLGQQVFKKTMGNENKTDEQSSDEANVD